MKICVFLLFPWMPTLKIQPDNLQVKINDVKVTEAKVKLTTSIHQLSSLTMSVFFKGAWPMYKQAFSLPRRDF